MSGYNPKIGEESIQVGSSSSSSVNEFPLLCETCLGSNPYLKMTKKPFGDKLCKISKIPFQGFKWKPGPSARYRETIVSKAVAMERNICQSCLNDMKYGLPVGVRDAMLTQPSNQIKMPESDVGQAYHHQNKSTSITSSSSSSTEDIALHIANAVPDHQMRQFSQLQQSASAKHSTSFRNLPKLCSFWLNGRCERVKKNTCPFRPCCGSFLFPEIAQKRDLHQQLIDQLTAEGPAVAQNKLSKEVLAAFRDNMKGNRDESIKKRVSGEDELSKSYVSKIQTMNVALEPPSDPFIVSLFLGNIDEGLTEDHIKAAIYPYGMYTNVHISRPSKCAFVDYIDRATAEQAARLMHNQLTIEGRVISVNWAKTARTAAPTHTPVGVVSFVPATAGVPMGYPSYVPMMPPPGMYFAPPYAYSLHGAPMPFMSSSNTTAAGGGGAGVNYAPYGPPPPAAPYQVGQVRGRDENESDKDEGRSNKKQYITSFSQSKR